MSEGYIFLLGYIFGSFLTLATIQLWDWIDRR
jgi:hypothetical protein